MRQFLLRKIPEKLYRQLRETAQKGKTSINKTVLSLLARSLGLEGNGDKKRNLSDLAGNWSKTEYKEFVKHTAVFERCDDEIWKS